MKIFFRKLIFYKQNHYIYCRVVLQEHCPVELSHQEVYRNVTNGGILLQRQPGLISARTLSSTAWLAFPACLIWVRLHVMTTLASRPCPTPFSFGRNFSHILRRSQDSSGPRKGNAKNTALLGKVVAAAFWDRPAGEGFMSQRRPCSFRVCRAFFAFCTAHNS